jgi:hypothetical protein
VTTNLGQRAFLPPAGISSLCSRSPRRQAIRIERCVVVVAAAVVCVFQKSSVSGIEKGNHHT